MNRALSLPESQIEESQLHDSEKIPAFPETFDHLLILAEKVLKYDTSGDMIISTTGQANALQVGLNGYRAVYNKTRTSTKHLEKFTEVYGKCRAQLIKDAPLEEFMEWFEKTSFVISPTAQSRNKIYLTAIFRNCCRIATRLAQELEKDPDQLSNPAAVYPEYFMLYLLRIFYHSADETDKNALIIPRIKELEKTLNLSSDEAPVIGDGLSELISAVTDVASDLGLDIPEMKNGFNGTKLRETINQFTKNGQAKNTIKELLGGVDLKDPKNLPNIIGNIVNKMQQTAEAVPEPVRRSMEATSEGITLPKQ